ncbi:MAG TPA: hypothetical protein VEA60_12205 [Allosphingosinicella sp.]|nr:hypothetical protein [Allosphingosinicella sp.]
MIRKLIAVALLALVAAPLVSLHQLGGSEAGASLSLLSEEGAPVFVLEVRGPACLEPLLAAVTL